jgi:hypothetical protein
MDWLIWGIASGGAAGGFTMLGLQANQILNRGKKRFSMVKAEKNSQDRNSAALKVLAGEYSAGSLNAPTLERAVLQNIMYLAGNGGLAYFPDQEWYRRTRILLYAGRGKQFGQFNEMFCSIMFRTLVPLNEQFKSLRVQRLGSDSKEYKQLVHEYRTAIKMIIAASSKYTIEMT